MAGRGASCMGCCSTCTLPAGRSSVRPAAVMLHNLLRSCASVVHVSAVCACSVAVLGSEEDRPCLLWWPACPCKCSAAPPANICTGRLSTQPRKLPADMATVLCLHTCAFCPAATPQLSPRGPHTPRGQAQPWRQASVSPRDPGWQLSPRQQSPTSPRLMSSSPGSGSCRALVDSASPAALGQRSSSPCPDSCRLLSQSPAPAARSQRSPSPGPVSHPIQLSPRSIEAGDLQPCSSEHWTEGCSATPGSSRSLSPLVSPRSVAMSGTSLSWYPACACSTLMLLSCLLPGTKSALPDWCMSKRESMQNC